MKSLNFVPMNPNSGTTQRVVRTNVRKPGTARSINGFAGVRVSIITAMNTSEWIENFTKCSITLRST